MTNTEIYAVLHQYLKSSTPQQSLQASHQSQHSKLQQTSNYLKKLGTS